jgi:hypothetical protein
LPKRIRIYFDYFCAYCSYRTGQLLLYYRAGTVRSCVCVYNIVTTIPDSRGELCGCEHHVTMVLPPVRCQDSTAAHTQNYHYIDREDNFFPFAGSRGCQSGSSTFRDVARPVVVVLRHSAVGFMLMRNSHSPSDRRRRPGVFMRPIWRNNGSSQVTAATDQVSIDTHRWRASGGVLSTVFCDGF